MAYIDKQIDIDVDDFYAAMDSDERGEMADLLIEEGYAFSVDDFNEDCDCEEGLKNHNTQGASDLAWDLEHINDNYFRISNEDLETIRKIAEKY